MIVSVQEQHLRGASVIEKWRHAQALGFDAIELRGAGEGRFAARLDELRAAAEAGVPMPTNCIEMNHFIGDFDADNRADAIAQLEQQIEVMARIGGRLIVTPAAYGMFSDRLPPFVSPRSASEDREVLLDSLSRLAEHARAHDLVIAVEPLNRYENHMVRTLDDAVSLCAEIGSPYLGVCADTYHMNIEEADPLQALVNSAEWIRHIQLSDTNRLEPGAGHLDWGAHLAVIEAIGYTRDMAYESRLSGPADEVLPASLRRLRQLAAA